MLIFLAGFIYAALGMHVMAWLSDEFTDAYEDVCGDDRGTWLSLAWRWWAVLVWPLTACLVFATEFFDGWSEG